MHCAKLYWQHCFSVTRRMKKVCEVVYHWWEGYHCNPSHKKPAMMHCSLFVLAIAAAQSCAFKMTLQLQKYAFCTVDISNKNTAVLLKQ
eukprot:7098014-Ditylum_brightwellii.AAC.1